MGGGGYDIGASLSMSSSATSGLQGNFRDIFGGVATGGFHLPKWALPVGIALVFVVSIVLIVRR